MKQNILVTTLSFVLFIPTLRSQDSVNIALIDYTNFEKYVTIAGKAIDAGNYKLGKAISLAVLNLKDTAERISVIPCTAQPDISNKLNLRKNTSCWNMFRILVEQGKYDSALFYVTAQDSVYKVIYDNCLTVENVDRVWMATSYARCYEGIDLDKAIDILLPYCFSPDIGLPFNSSADDDEAGKYGMGVLVRLLKKKHHYSSIEMNKILDDAIKSIKHDGYKATIILFGKTIDMSSPYQKDGTTNPITAGRKTKTPRQKYYVEAFTNSYFYYHLKESSRK